MQDGTVFYRRQQLYSVPGKFPDFGDHISAGCRYGGPIGSYMPLEICAAWYSDDLYSHDA